MKYSNLLLYLLKWGSGYYVKDLREKEAYNSAMNNPEVDSYYKKELKEAREEYLEYLKEETEINKRDFSKKLREKYDKELKEQGVNSPTILNWWSGYANWLEMKLKMQERFHVE